MNESKIDYDEYKSDHVNNNLLIEIPEYTYLKKIGKNVCLCKNQKNKLFVVKYAKSNDPLLMKEIVLTRFFSNGVYILNEKSNIATNQLLNPQQSLTQVITPLIIRVSKYSILNNFFSFLNFLYDRIVCSIIHSYSCFSSCQETSDDNDSKNEDTYIKPIERITDNMIRFKICNSTFPYSYFCKFVNTIMVSDKSYLITEYSGKDLFEYTISKKKLTETEAKCIFQQIVYALKSLHSIGITHGDMSLENVCVEIKNDVINGQQTKITNINIIDYECSLIHPNSPYYPIVPINEQSSITTILTDNKSDYQTKFITKLNPTKIIYTIYGKELYISPERLDANYKNNKSYCSFKDDIFSLGQMLFAMLTGTFLYDSPTLTDPLFIKVISGDWFLHPYNSNIINMSTDVIDLIDKIIKPEHSRISIDEIIKHRWMQ